MLQLLVFTFTSFINIIKIITNTTAGIVRILNVDSVISSSSKKIVVLILTIMFLVFIVLTAFFYNIFLRNGSKINIITAAFVSIFGLLFVGIDFYVFWQEHN